MVNVAINGFGRIGRQTFKIAFRNPNLNIVAVNDLTDVETLAHLLRYDTVYGKYEKEVSTKIDGDKHFLIIAGKEFQVFSQKDPAALPWKDLNIDVVLECTGVFVNDRASEAHLKAGAKKVILSAPAKGAGEVPTFLIGVNENQYHEDNIISNGSCTTNCVGPVTAVMYSKFGIEKAAMTTIHSYTADQTLVDGPHKDLRRARAAAANIVPTTTGAAVSVTEAIPNLKGKFDGLAIRVPTICGSLTDFTFITKENVTIEQINEAFKDASQNNIYKNVLQVTEDPVVSSDIIGNPASAIVDLSLTNVIDGNLVKVFAWYDNEYAYSLRLVEMIEAISNN